jgi:hypothetical protein
MSRRKNFVFQDGRDKAQAVTTDQNWSRMTSKPDFLKTKSPTRGYRKTHSRLHIYRKPYVFFKWLLRISLIRKTQGRRIAIRVN